MGKHAKAQPTTDQGASRKVTKKRQRKGSGSVRQRGNVWYISYTVGGRRVEVATAATTKTGAASLLVDAIAAAKAVSNGVAPVKGSAPAPEPGSAVSPYRLSDAKKLIDEDYQIKENRSTDRMEQAYKHLFAYFGDTALADIDRQRIVDYTLARRTQGKELAEERAAKRAAREAKRGPIRNGAQEKKAENGLGKGTIRCELAILRRMLNLAYDSDLLERVPRFQMPPEARPRQGFFETDEFNAVLEKLHSELRPALRFAMMTGWRFNKEVLGLTWAHVDFRRGRITLSKEETKEKFDREFPFAVYPALGELLRRQRAITDLYEAHHPGEKVKWVFHESGERLSKDYHDAWDKACREANQPDKLVHDLRRTTARNLSKAQVPTQTAMRLLGHQTMSTHIRYQIVSQPDLTSGVAALAAGEDALSPVEAALNRDAQGNISREDLESPEAP